MLSLYRINLLTLWFSIVLCCLSGCGYKIIGKPDYLEKYSTIYISPWINYTSEPQIGELISYYLRLKISEGNLLIPVFDEKKADLILKGRVKLISFSPVTYETFLKTKERKINFVGEYQLIEVSTGNVIFKSKISQDKIYTVQEEISETLDPGKKQALDLLAQDVADEIIHQLFLNSKSFEHTN